MAQQGGDPFGIFDVRLAPRHGPQVVRIDHQQLHITAFLEYVVDRLPVHAGCFHGDMRAATLGQPAAQLGQVGGHGAERAHPTIERTVSSRPQHARHDRFLVHVQSGAPFMYDVHRSLPLDQILVAPRSGDTSCSDSPTRARSNSQRCLPVSQAILRSGLDAPGETRPRCPAAPSQPTAHHIPFSSSLVGRRPMNSSG